MAYGKSYEDKNERYRADIRQNYTYLTREIQLNLILPHLQETLHPSDYQSLQRRSNNNSDWICNQDLFGCLQKREYWWRALRKALIEIRRTDIIERLGWIEKFDFGPDHGPRNEQNFRASSNPPQNDEKPNKKFEAIEDFTQRKLDVYKKQNDLSKASDYSKSEKCEQDRRDVDSNLSSSKCEQEKYDTDYRKILSDETELEKVPKTEIHPAVRNNLPLNFLPSYMDQDEKRLKPALKSVTSTSLDEGAANLNPRSFSPVESDKISNSESPMMGTEPGAVAFKPTFQPSSIHRNLSAPIMNLDSRPFSGLQKHKSIGAMPELNKKEDGDEFNPSVISTDQSPMLVPPSIDLRNIERKEDLSDAEEQEVHLREQNLQLHERGDNDSLSKQDGNWSDSVPENLESGTNNGQNSDTAIQEICPPTSTYQSNMAASMTTNDDVIRPSIASTVDPTGVSRKYNVRGEITLRHRSSNLSKEPDSYVTGLHSYGSDVTSSIQSESQRSNPDIDQTEAKTFASITRVDVFDDWKIDFDDLDPSSIQSPDALRLDEADRVPGPVPSVANVADDNRPASNSPATELNFVAVQNSADVKNPTQVPGDTMPKFDSLLSGTNYSQPINNNQNLALSDLPLDQSRNRNVPEFSELFSQGSSVDPSDYVERGVFSGVSVAFPPSSTQFHADGSSAANNVDNVASNMQPENNIVESEGNPNRSSLMRRISNTFDSIVEMVFPASELAE